MTILRRFTAGVSAQWLAMHGSDRRRLMIVVLAVPMAALYAANAHTGSEPEEALFTGLSESEAQWVCGRLNEWHVPFDTRDGGQTVLVPADRSAELIVEFAKWAPLETLDSRYPNVGQARDDNTPRGALSHTVWDRSQQLAQRRKLRN